METRDFDGIKVTIKGADDVTDDEIRYYIYHIHKYVDFSLDEIDELEIYINASGEVDLYYEGKCSGGTTLKKRIKKDD